jgi:fructose-bisphosphate aldolase class II
MTLHGGSGTDDDDFRKAIEAGMTVVHISTEVRLAWRRGMDAAFAQQPNEIVPYKLLPPAVDSVRQVIQSRLVLFNAGRHARSAAQ